MINKVILEGTLTGIKKFSEKVGSASIKVRTEVKGVEYDNTFNVTVFKGQLERLEAVPIGSLVALEGKLKNGCYEKDGQKIWKLEILMSHFTFDAEVGVPTRIATMSPNDQKYRANSDFGEDVYENIPF